MDPLSFKFYMNEQKTGIDPVDKYNCRTTSCEFITFGICL